MRVCLKDGMDPDTGRIAAGNARASEDAVLGFLHRDAEAVEALFEKIS